MLETVGEGSEMTWLEHVTDDEYHYPTLSSCADVRGYPPAAFTDIRSGKILGGRSPVGVPAI